MHDFESRSKRGYRVHVYLEAIDLAVPADPEKACLDRTRSSLLIYLYRLRSCATSIRGIQSLMLSIWRA